MARDDRKAMDFLKEAVEQEDPFAACEIGTLYLDGVGIAHNKVQAYRWLVRRGAADERCEKRLATLVKPITPRELELAETDPSDTAKAGQRAMSDPASRKTRE